MVVILRIVISNVRIADRPLPVLFVKLQLMDASHNASRRFTDAISKAGDTLDAATALSKTIYKIRTTKGVFHLMTQMFYLFFYLFCTP